MRKSLFWRCERFPCAFWLRRREDTMPSTADWSLHDVSPAPRQLVQELKKSPETAVWGRIWFCGNGKKRSMHAHRARKSNHQPSHIDDWMYVKLAMLKINVNENRVKNANFRGFLSKLPLPGSEMAGRSPRKGDRIGRGCPILSRLFAKGWVNTPRLRNSLSARGAPAANQPHNRQPT